MYLKHFKLGQKPFENTTDPRFFWFSESVAAAHAALSRALEENKGVMLLTGDSGSGKTALIIAFLETVDPQVSVAVIPDPDMEAVDFFNYLILELGLQQKFSNKGDFLIFFKRFLQETVRPNDGKLLIVIDEAQRAANRLLADIQLLDILDADSKTAVHILLAGQPGIVDVLADPENVALKTRLTVGIRIEPLDAADTGKYIHHRLETAGARDTIFTPGAVEKIFQFTGGNPLRINTLCDRALLTGCANGVHGIDPETVSECAGELDITLATNTENSPFL